VAAGFVVLLPEESTVVVVYWQTGVQFTLVLVAPLTVAVRVIDWPKIGLVVGEALSDTVMTLAPLLLPQPLDRSTQRAASPAPRIFKTAGNFTPTISPTD